MSELSSPVPSRRGSAASNRRPSGGLGSRLQKLTGLNDPVSDPGVVQMDGPSVYRRGSVSQRRESRPSTPGRGSFTRYVTSRCEGRGGGKGCESGWGAIPSSIHEIAQDDRRTRRKATDRYDMTYHTSCSHLHHPRCAATLWSLRRRRRRQPLSTSRSRRGYPCPSLATFDDSSSLGAWTTSPTTPRRQRIAPLPFNPACASTCLR